MKHDEIGCLNKGEIKKIPRKVQNGRKRSDLNAKKIILTNLENQI